MYRTFYHLTADPFNPHPATDTFFISSTHKEAWYYLLFGIDTQEPFLVLTGEYGMGKTLLCLQLLKIAKEKGIHRIEYIPTTNEGYGGILRRVATNMGISPLPENEEILQDMIHDRFRAEKDQTRFYLIIDDAHELDITTLSKLKYLSTFNYNEFFPIVIVFVAHPSFLQDLKTSALSSLNQRIKRRYHLSKFNLEDTKNYIYYRLLKSGATGIPSFSDETIQKIYEYSGGVPRLINNICDTCLLIGASNHMASIPPSVVEDARKLVEGSLTDTEEQAVKDPDPGYAHGDTTVFSEDVQTGDANTQGNDFSNKMFVDEYEQDSAPPNVSAPRKKNKNLMIILFAVILLIAVVVLLSKSFTKDYDIFPGSSSKKATTQERPTVSQERPPAPVDKPDVKNPTLPVEKSDAKSPVLRDELPVKPSDQTRTPSDRTGSATPARNDGPLKK
jgi:type II secretory pathway predicted ATPase ExeA